MAREVRDSGEPLQLNAVAHRANVGVGTVYRHFASAQALREGLVEHQFADLIALAARVTRLRDPVAALREFMAHALALYAADEAFATITTAPTLERSETAALRDELAAAFDRLVQSSAGSLRPGLDATDLLLLLCGIGYSARMRPDKATDYLRAMLDGILADDE
ncbi:TetR/AcrR family transcriptional regulator [Tsukamurella soli]|uniref:TetR/AcrR family transcriptional regulator n=1 Tax=Tsukamurella soli TaxID=644556 RepID=A0ABP8KH49_9ACTN